VLGAFVVGLLNFALYQAVLRSVTERSRKQLAMVTDVMHSQLVDQLADARNDAQVLARDPSVRTVIQRVRGGVHSRDDLTFLDDLRGALGFERVDLVADGVPLISLPAGSAVPVYRPDVAQLAYRAERAGDLVFGDVNARSPNVLDAGLALPLPGDADQTGGVVLVMSVALVARSAGTPGAESDVAAAAQSLLARQHGDELLIIRIATGKRERIIAGLPGTRGAEIAAAGVESNTTYREPEADTRFVSTRYLSELGWGMAVEIPNSVVFEEMKVVIAGLLILDVVMALGALVTISFWRRRFAVGLAEREMEITRRHAQRMQAVFDTAFDAILTFDREGRLLSANRAAERLFGRPAADLDGILLRSLIRQGGTENALPEPGAVGVAEGLRADGGTFPAEVSVDRSGEADELLYTAIVRDVSERVEAERQIRTFAEGLEASNRRLEELNAQLEEVSRLKSEFLANTSHELRTPLNGMIGFLQLVLDGMCKDPGEEREFLTQALSCSRHLLGLINDVLDIAKIEAGKLSLEVAPVDAEQLFAEVHTITHVQAAQKGIALRMAPGGKGITVRADFNKAKQVLVNLVGNSIKFTEKGSVTVKATAHPDLGHVMFEVVDTGVGIPTERQTVIFDKFMQADGSTTRRYGGTGLGLAISRSLVELMGGIIGVKSEGVGKGTNIYFSLPIWHELQPDQALPESDRILGPANGVLVLLVEDDPAFRQFLRTVLHGRGYRTVEAAGAEQAWLLVRRHAPAVVILDYALSCAENARLRTGWDLAERLTTTPETRHIPLIFVTGFDNELRDKLHSTAFARRPEHLTKPIDAHALLAKVESVLGPRPGRVIRVLVAEDDPAVVAFVRKVLSGDRFQMEIARNGEECLHVLRTQPNAFDLLLLDLMMPDVSGYDVLREMVLTGTAPELPVLVLTNFTEPSNAEERRLLSDGLVMEVLPKSTVHDNPMLLAHILDWHVQVARDDPREAA
jgi:PAS domain S-box-containing protein